LAAAATSHLLSRRVGFNLKPVPAGTSPDEATALARATFQASTVLRFALGDSVALVALVLSFLVQPVTWMAYLIGGALALVLLAVNVWPGAGIISKAQQQLDREGGPSFLHDALLCGAQGRHRRRPSAADFSWLRVRAPSQAAKMSR
jgi:hypothetical protein